MVDDIEFALNAMNLNNYLSIHDNPNLLVCPDTQIPSKCLPNVLSFHEMLDKDCAFLFKIIEEDSPEIYSKTDKITKGSLRKYLKTVGYSERRITKILKEFSRVYRLCFEE